MFTEECKTAVGEQETEKEVLLVAPAKLERPLSVVRLIQAGDLRVMPIIAIDFSMGNLTF